MKGIYFDFEGRQHRLALTAGALLEIYDAYPEAEGVVSPIEGNSPEAWAASCRMMEILSRYGEAQRKYLGEDALPPIRAAELLAKAAPADAVTIKAAIHEAIYVGFERSTEDPRREVDLILEQLEQKKTQKRSGHGWLSRLAVAWAYLKGSYT